MKVIISLSWHSIQHTMSDDNDKSKKKRPRPTIAKRCSTCSSDAICHGGGASCDCSNKNVLCEVTNAEHCAFLHKRSKQPEYENVVEDLMKKLQQAAMAGDDALYWYHLGAPPKSYDVDYVLRRLASHGFRCEINNGRAFLCFLLSDD